MHAVAFFFSTGAAVLQLDDKWIDKVDLSLLINNLPSETVKELCQKFKVKSNKDTEKHTLLDSVIEWRDDKKEKHKRAYSELCTAIADMNVAGRCTHLLFRWIDSSWLLLIFALVVFNYFLVLDSRITFTFWKYVADRGVYNFVGMIWWHNCLNFFFPVKYCILFKK